MATGELIESKQPAGSNELAVSAQQAMAQKEIEVSMIVAQRSPRNEDVAFERIMKSCGRSTFAEMSTYSFPRGGQAIEGPSVNLAREIARCWGNLRYGFDVVHDDDNCRTLRAWAWDMETNTRRSQDATFRKLVQRRGKGWIAPDERDLRELTNKHGETAVRNCLLHLVPPDVVEDAMRACKDTLTKQAAKDPDAARKGLIKAFGSLGISVEQLELYLKHPLRQIGPQEIADLRAVWKSTSDGNSKWAEYVPQTQVAASNGAVSAADLIKPATTPEPAPDAPELTPTDDPWSALRERAAACQTLEALDGLEADACLDASEEEQAAIRGVLSERRGQLSRRKGGKQRELVE